MTIKVISFGSSRHGLSIDRFFKKFQSHLTFFSYSQSTKTVERIVFPFLMLSLHRVLLIIYKLHRPIENKVENATLTKTKLQLILYHSKALFNGYAFE